MREEIAIKNVVQGRRLEGDSPWLLFFVLSTLAPRALSLSLSLYCVLPLSPPSLSLSFIFFLSLALQSAVVGVHGFYATLYFLHVLLAFFLEKPFRDIFFFETRKARRYSLL